MLADAIMTRDVASVRVDTPVLQVAELMAQKRISGVPVVNDAGDLIGMVSETDLLHRAEIGTEKKRKWWIALFIDSDMRARDFIKVHGLTAGDIMSRLIVSVPHDAPMMQVADILEANNLKRVTVVRDGKLAGIITRGDIVRAFVDAAAMKDTPQREPAALQRAIGERLAAQSWLNPDYVAVLVTDAVVEIRGIVGSQDQFKALDILVREVAGSRAVDNQVVVGSRGRLSAI